jgi:hypothetical protein
MLETRGERGDFEDGEVKMRSPVPSWVSPINSWARIASRRGERLAWKVSARACPEWSRTGFPSPFGMLPADLFGDLFLDPLFLDGS